ncbi:hybrid sensor histidine kinase/response regulator [Microvirga pudoricolor]|uniref:hybrid sensor histidine kinase/response regulator n=1 Tax=Microvirga pudoricolor TaxID=2778729 RepID=UPI00194F13E6|nr:hybrid sensor histidine kinase/response regulator [Microvirga pudoricolor]MBM6595239.1 PAS domain-containing protein [Microvirga pudoricolor]
MTIPNPHISEPLREAHRAGGPVLAALLRSDTAAAILDLRAPHRPVLAVNAAMEALTDTAKGALVGQGTDTLWLPGTRSDTLVRLGHALDGGPAADGEVPGLRHGVAGTPLKVFIAPFGTEAAFAIATFTPLESRAAATEAQLTAATERLRLTLDVAGSAGSWDWDIRARRLTADDRFAALYGLDPEQAASGLPQSVFFSVIHPQDRPRIQMAVAGIVEGAELFSKEFRVRAPDGSWRWVHARGRSHPDEAGEPIRFTGILVDITDQKRISERLRIAQTAGGIGTFEYVEGFGTATVSRQFCELLGLHTASVLPVKTINALVCAGHVFLADAHADGGERSASIETRIRRADDGEVRWLARRGEFVEDAETDGVRFVGVVYDITETKLAEAYLQNLNETLEERVEQRTQERDRVWSLSRDLFATCAMDGTIRQANPAWLDMLGYAPGEIVGTRLEVLVHDEDRAGLKDHYASLRKGFATHDLDVRFRHRDGSDRWINWTLTPETEVFHGIGRDVSQRKVLEDQLRQAQKMEAVGQLTGGIAHDFNNLLTGIIGSLDLMQTRMAQGRHDTLERYAKAAMTSANRAAALTHRLLAFARRQPLDPKPVNANQLVTSMEELLRRTMAENIRLELVTSGGLWLTLCDPHQLESAILNLAINARDAMPDGGVLTIETANAHLDSAYAAAQTDVEPGQYVAICVSDTGTGMPADIIAQAFDPFFTTKPIGQGTGLGLSMVYGFAKQSQGHVRIYSEVGQGTTLKIYLPRYHGDVEAEAAHGGLGDIRRADSGETVLVVEDEPVVRALILDVLEDQGYTVLEAVDGPSGLKILESARRIDLLVTDVGLPGINGRQLADYARSFRPSLKILFITGYAENAAIASGFLDPGMEMITKPFAVEALATRIRRMIESSPVGS